MSRVVPGKRTEIVAFFKARLENWTASPTLIGTTAAAVEDLATKVANAEAARAAQETALAAARAKTQAFYDAVDALNNQGSSIVKQIRAAGQATGNPLVWETAMIPPPAIPSPVGPPGQPYGFKVELDHNGGLIITWKADNPRGAQGTIYRVFRTIDDGAQTYLADTGSKYLTDTTIPAGASQVKYTIQGVRSTAGGIWGNFIVKFGTGANGQATASITEAAPKLAA